MDRGESDSQLGWGTGTINSRNTDRLIIQHSAAMCSFILTLLRSWLDEKTKLNIHSLDFNFIFLVLRPRWPIEKPTTVTIYIKHDRVLSFQKMRHKWTFGFCPYPCSDMCRLVASNMARGLSSHWRGMQLMLEIQSVHIEPSHRAAGVCFSNGLAESDGKKSSRWDGDG